jgi:hypothetical protein
MKHYILFCFSCFCLLLYCAGCVSYTTLQNAETLEPGKVLLGGGSAFPHAEDGTAFTPEVNARVGIVKQFDVGAKFATPSLYFLDAKLQILNGPIALSVDLGWSYFSYSETPGKSKGTSTGWYPMLIAGQDHWYVAVKEVYFSTEGEFEFFGLNKFEGSGWITTNLVVGGVIGTNIRLLPELNLIVPRTGKSLLVPAVGLQFVL